MPKYCHREKEKRRRERINSCIAELRKLLPVSCDNQYNSRKDQSDILESVVKYLRVCQKKNQEYTGKPNHLNIADTRHKGTLGALDSQRYLNGFTECAGEILRYLNSTAHMHPYDPRYVAVAKYLQYRTCEITNSFTYSTQCGLFSVNSANTDPRQRVHEDAAVLCSCSMCQGSKVLLRLQNFSNTFRPL